MVDYATRIKEQLSIAKVLKHYGFEPNRAGFMLCPMHKEDTPSLKIYPESNSYYCFGCGTGGDVINFVMHLFHLDFKSVLFRLDTDFHLGIIDGPRPSSLAVKRQKHERWKQNRELQSFRNDYAHKTVEARILRHLEKPPEDTPQDSPIWGMYAELMGRLDYLDNYYFAYTRWR